LPVASGFGAPRLEPAHVIFLSATLAVGWLNHLPTRAGVAVSLAAIACALELFRMAGGDLALVAVWTSRTLLAVAPWVAWLALSVSRPSNEFDRIWLGFRDRYGFLWSERVREQFNRSVASAGRQERLAWHGLRPTGADDGEALNTLRALLKRFGSADGDSARRAHRGAGAPP